MRDRFIRALISIPLFSDLFFLVLSAYSKLNHNPNYLKEGAIQSKSNKDTSEWFIRISAPRNPSSKLWGDYYFATEIQASLAKLGIGSQILFRGDNKPLPKNSVNLVIRGIYPSRPAHGAKNLLWIISHPNQISKSEIEKFDFVFAASENWASQKSQTWGTEIETLLQATNPDRFHLLEENNSKRNTDISFVGSSTHRKHKLVNDVMQMGFEVSIYGSGWHGAAPEGYVKAEFVENAKLPEIYQTSKIVLNDHWSDMNKNGFISNRAFDAIAAGAFVVTDLDPLSIEKYEGLMFSFDDPNQMELGIKKLLNQKHTENIVKFLEFGQENSFDNRVSTIIKKLNSSKATKS